MSWQLIVAIVVLAIVIFLYIAYKKLEKSPRFKGDCGEGAIIRILDNAPDVAPYVIHDLVFADKEGHTCQIDHICINSRGIWVIETKNYAGRIYGSENQQNWTQVLAYGKEKRPFYNPVKQNKTHIYRLAEILEVQGCFHNVVVFTKRADISNVSANEVCREETLIETLSRDTKVSLSEEEMSAYHEKILAFLDENAIDIEEHVANIHAMQEKIEQNICPRCGGKLVLRCGKYGQFYGCANYPKCKFSKSAEDRNDDGEIDKQNDRGYNKIA